MRRLLTMFALVLASCGTSGEPAATVAPTVAPTVVVPDQTAATLAPLGSPGVITFGEPIALDQDTLLIDPSKDSFQVSTQKIAWSAKLKEPAGAASLTLIVAKVSAGGVETIKWQDEVPVSRPTFDLFANSSDLALLLDREAGTYVMRYLREVEILAEGTFTLTK